MTQGNPPPDPADEHRARAVELRKQGKFSEAMAELEQALKLRPDFPQAYFNIAAIRMEQGRVEEAIPVFRKALELKPDYHQAMTSMANCYRRLGKLRQAIELCEDAIEIKPDDCDAHATLATVLHAAHRMDDAMEEFEYALSLRPRDARILNNFGNLLTDLDHPVRASECFRTAVLAEPNRPELYISLANLLKTQGDLDEAITCYRKVLALRPENVGAHSNLLLTLNCHPRSVEGLLPAHRGWAERHAARFYPPGEFVFPNERSPDRRLRIGYVSADFRRHSVAYFIEPVLSSHDKSRFEIFCYNDAARTDEVTVRLKSCADQWRDIVGLTDERVDQIVREDKIDILVDLAGHTGGGRLLVFARKPAPVQVSYLGYPNTTGVKTIDYRLTDAQADPPGISDRCVTEKLVRLPHGFLCYRPFEKAPVVRDLTVTGATDFPITFGTFNNFAKVTPQMLKVWAQILNELPDATLLIKAESLCDNEIRQAVRNTFAEQGGDPLRLEAIGREPSAVKHLATYHRVDIALDTYPYNGTTTTCEALWMGVPVITLAGPTHHSRVGVSLLTRIGLDELIADNPEEYVSIAVALAKDTARRVQIASSLRTRMRKSPLMDAAGFTRDLEDAYRKMWRTWCAAGK
jgi:predicted O-linked N-acetylglucosamine transferase (SPINDLY family)